MPLGVAAQLFSNLPEAGSYIIDPTKFLELTSPVKAQLNNQSFPTSGPVMQAMAKEGVLSHLRVVLTGTLVVGVAAATTGTDWPYGLLDEFKLSVSGGKDLWYCNGKDLDALRIVNHRPVAQAVDQFTGTVGGGDTVAVGSYPFYLNYDVPIAIDQSSLAAALFCQSDSGVINTSVEIAALASPLITPGATGTVAITGGTISYFPKHFSVPYDNQGKLILPDLSMIHMFNAVELPFSSTGLVPFDLIKTGGQLERLFWSGQVSSGSPLSALPNAASTNKIDAANFSFGLATTPINWTPAAVAASENQDAYGQVLPYDRYVLDTLENNAIRDAILLMGMTTPRVEVTIDSGVTPTATSKMRFVEEVLV